jgi:hypothetical protein
MNKYSALFISMTLVIMACQAQPARAVDLGQIEKDLSAKGVEGWIHGAVSDRDLYVFTYRTPGNFFDYVEMSLVAEKPEIAAKLPTLNRHDRVRIKGSFLKNPSPQKHISVDSLEVLEKYESGEKSEPYEHEAKLPGDLLNTTSGDFLVHAIGGEGRILVVEFKDQIVPVYVKKPELTKNLFRGDLIQLHYKIQDRPDSPTHLNLDDSAVEPVKVLESITSLHGKPAVIEGALIMFPKSPEIIFNVFAVQQELQSGLKRQYTLVNFEDPAAFAKIREKLQAAWDKHKGETVNGRNKLVSLRIKVKATGTFNEVDPNQANPQILLKSAASVEIIE